MIRSGVGALLACLSLVAFVACDGSDVVVFSAATGGGAGVPALAGSGGAPLMVGMGGMPGELGGGVNVSSGSSGGGGAGAGGAGASGAGGPGASGAGGAMGMPCHSLSDCLGPTWLCEKRGCGDDLGVCKPRQVMCDSVQAPVCGCDHHITYWNDCLRDEYGESASTPGKCGGDARPCKNNGECGDGAICSFLLPPNAMCGQPAGSGTCWVTPIDCPPGDAHWTLCPEGGGAAQGGCMTMCEAVQAGCPAVPLPHGASCP